MERPVNVGNADAKIPGIRCSVSLNPPLSIFRIQIPTASYQRQIREKTTLTAFDIAWVTNSVSNYAYEKLLQARDRSVLAGFLPFARGDRANGAGKINDCYSGERKRLLGRLQQALERATAAAQG